MSVLAVLVAFAVLIATQAHPITQEDKAELYAFHRDCLIKTGIDRKIVEESHEGQFPDVPKLKEYFLCISHKAGVLNETGEFQMEVIRKKLEKHTTDAAEIDTIVEKCVMKKDTPEESAFNMFRCFHENLRSHGDMSFYVIHVTEEKQQLIKKYCRECMEETKVDMKVVEAARKGEYSDDPALKKYALCMSKRLGFHSAEGILQMDVIKQKLIKVLKDDARAEKLFAGCVNEKETPEDTASELLKCFHQKTHLNFLEPIVLPPEKVEKISAFHKECLDETSVDLALINAASKGNFSEDAKLKEYLFCLSKKDELQNEDGEIQKEVLRKKFTELLKDPVLSQQLVEKCAVQKDTPQNTAFNAVKCYYENTPNHISILQVITLDEEEKQKLTKYNTECQTESGIDSATVELVKKGQYTESDKFKNHLFCFYKKLGLQNEAGEIQKEILSEKFGQLHKDVALSDKLFRKCAVRKDTPQDTAYQAFVCYLENTPSHFNVFALF